ncbi:hypothetical protein SAMN05421730_1001577 [Anaerobium acetethylicum]|uniref:UPF0122 protein SAMN05421730_1001577 n=2 Tax=Anaerobium acetethylicum TaxID=1619234 RepID=A0A1D3TPQ8_9FIRM|nr:DNA-binding protein [Anaerobium acetethylicum]SCP95452.1 hypothetical protein SAMN05421730_1001577 [Anaerobium acetethylicum]
MPEIKKDIEAVKKKHLTASWDCYMIAEVMAMERIAEQALLYDFYGELLTSHQKQIYEDIVLNDLSLSEIAEDQGISRQGVHDLVKRCNKILADYENKLHLVEKFLSTKEKVNRINLLIKEYRTVEKEELIAQIEQISNEILEEL